MFFDKSPPLSDPAALRFRMATLNTGAWLGIAMVLAGLAYFGLTWDEGNRPLLAGIGIAVGVSDVGVLLLPMQRIVAGRWRESFFLGWTLLTVAVVLLLGALDYTSPSPLTLPLMMPMLFAGMSYPPASARICCAAAVFGYAAEVLILGQASAFSGFLFMVLLWTAGMCLWQAHNREQQHEELQRQQRLTAAGRAADKRRPPSRQTAARHLVETADARRRLRQLGANHAHVLSLSRHRTGAGTTTHPS